MVANHQISRQFLALLGFVELMKFVRRPYVDPVAIISVLTMADTCLVLFFLLELATHCEYKAVITFTTCLKHLQRVLNISNAFETLATCCKY